ncbi:MAG: Gfo/Idh/MocA family oxidoreductase [Victivallaceae bacterium]
MKKKIGFVDLFIDEWHSGNYPKWFKEAPLGGDFEVAMAWEEAPAGGRPLDVWCREMGIAPEKSLEKLVETCDAICVLSPSNSEAHERLAEIPLASGKPVYIDKPFAPDRATAERIFARADKFHTPLFSSSALRFPDELIAARKELSGAAVDFMAVRGGGRSFEEYSIHQIEMIVSTMGCGIKKVMQCGYGSTNHLLLEYADGRRAAMTLNHNLPFGASITGKGRVSDLPQLSNFFPNLIAAMLEFYAGGPAPVCRKETVEIAAVVDTAIRALKTPDVWMKVD